MRLQAYRGPTKPPAAVVAAKAMYEDPRAEPAHAERIPYCVVYGEPGARLVDMVVTPTVLTDSRGRRRLHAKYYITKQASHPQPLHSHRNSITIVAILSMLRFKIYATYCSKRAAV